MLALGASYNPALEDHQALLLKAHTKEVIKEEEKKHIDRKFDVKLPEGEEPVTEVGSIKI